MQNTRPEDSSRSRSATALLEVELGELLGDANITLKLGRLERMPIAHGVPDGIEHDLGVSDGFPIQNLLDQNAQLVGDAVEDVAHRAGHVQADDDCVAGGMVTPIAALPHLDVLGVKLGFHVGAGIYLGRAPPADSPLRIAVPILRSPTSAAHNKSLL